MVCGFLFKSPSTDPQPYISLLFTVFFCAIPRFPAVLKLYPYILITIRKNEETCQNSVGCKDKEGTTAGCTALWTIHTLLE